MKKLSEFVTKNKMKIGVLLLCFMVLIVACIYYANNNKQIATIPTPEERELKAQLDTAPEGYTPISSKEQLAEIKDNLSGKYILMADIDMTDVVFEPIGTNNNTPFTGTFDGNYHKISNLKIESTNQYVGMFGYIDSGTVENLTLENVNITGTNQVGGLAGSNSKGTVTNVVVTGEVKGTGNNIGGLIGYLGGTRIGSIINSYSTAKVTGVSYVGGLVGHSYGIITNAYSTGEVTGTSYVGGIVGENAGDIRNTYSVAKVTGTSYVGGLVGRIGVISNVSGTVTNSHWALDISNQRTSAGGEGKIFSAMLKQNTYKNWDFDTIWKIEEGATLPYLRSMIKPEAVKKENYDYVEWEGEGTESNPYLVKTAKQLNGVNNLLTVHYKLANDIDMTDVAYEVIGQTSSTPFAGTFDGAGHKISNLKVESGNQYVGMFGYVRGGTIKNLLLENVNIKGTSTHVGGLAGYNYNGTITNVGVTGEVTSTSNYVGGLLGYNSGTVTNAYSTVAVSGGSSYVGGLIGDARGTITNTYAVGKVIATGTSNIGGLTGYKSGTVTNSYWAVDTTTQVISSSGEVKFFSSMLKQATFKNWDFDTTWQIEEGVTLPYLRGMTKPTGVNKTSYTYTQWEGNGTEENPYLIKTVQQLQEVKNILNAHYKLANDIDMQDEEFEVIGQTQARPFTGTFDGNNHKISNLKVESANQYVGMFGYINGGTIKNLGLENVNIKGTANNSYVGGLVGQLNSGTVTNVGVTGEVTSTNNYAGGITVNNSGTITNSYVNATITGKNYVGGLVGDNKGIITNSYVSGNVNGVSYVGGLVGYNVGTITNAYSTAAVTGTSYIGGLIGQSYSGSITNTYAVGKVTATGTQYVGGLTGYKSGTVNNSYWSVDTTGQAISTGGEGRFFSAMLKEGSYTSWDFETVWKIEEGTTLPYLRGMTKPEAIKKENYTYAEWEGAGTEEFPYLIKTKEQLKAVNNLLTAHYKLANDIDMTDEVYEPIGTNTRPFAGTFDGNNHKISNLKIESENQYVGMFGYISGGKIKNLLLENISVKGTNTYVGGLAGSNYNGTITNVGVTGEITSTNNYVGGLLGYNGGTVTNAYSTATVSGGASYVGGLIGDARGTVTNTYAVGKVTATGTSQVGGLTGYRGGTVSNSYWSIDTTGQTTSSGGESKTLYEMLQKSTYQNWDFDATWQMKEYNGLPYLKGMAKPEGIEITNLEGKGTEDAPYLIKTPEDLKQKQYLPNVYYKLANDIDASQLENYVPETFGAILDGDNYTISNLTIKSNDQYTGLFKENNGTIKNLKLSNVNIESSYNGETSYVGGACAYNNGTIKNVEITGNINNKGEVENLYLGQITGYNNSIINKTHSNGTLTNEGNVTNAYVGGIAGSNDVTIRISYNTGNMSVRNVQNLNIGGIAGISNYISDAYSKGNMEINATSANIGGIAGKNVGIIRNSYSTDNINSQAETVNEGGIVGENKGILKATYYNNSKIAEQEDKGTLKTIEELKQQVTFEEWNFEDIWNIEENINTPVFKDIFNNDDNYYGEDEYEMDSFWEWHTRTTTNDQAYNGKHIVINPGKSIDFYGYGVTSYKDYLYKYYSNAGEKTFMFKIDETKANYHTLDGAGFIFNASKKDNLLSGYVLLIRQNDICIYRLDNVNATQFETGSNATVQTYAGNPIASVAKTSSTTHNLIIKTSPTNVTVIDNGEEILNTALDYSKHAGEDFGLIASYAQHNCYLLSEIQFLNFVMDVTDYSIPVIKINEIGKRISGAKFQIKNEAGEVIREGTSNSNGIYNIKGLQEGIYTLEEIEAPAKHAFKNNIFTFKVTSAGKVVDVNTEEEIQIKIVNNRLKFEVKVVDTTGNPIPNSKISLYDEDGNVVLGSDGQPIVVTTGPDGTAIITDIEEGKYTFKQTEVPSDYIIDDTIYTGEIKKDGTVIIGDKGSGTITNKKYGNVTIRKYETGNTKVLKGAVIEIKDASGNVVTVTTNENGLATFRAVPGTYTYKETVAPSGYILNNAEYHFTVNDDGTVTFDTANGIIYNEKEIKDIVIMKDPFTVIKYRTGTEIALSGAVIGVFDESGNEISRQTTGESGTITISGLEVGEYYYKEIQAPAGYLLNSTEYHFTVNNDGTVTAGENTTFVIYNDREIVYGDVTIRKYITDTETPLAGAVIGIFRQDGTPMTDKEGNPVQITTNEEGTIAFRITPGTYRYKEITAPQGYVLNCTTYTFTVSEEGIVTFDSANGIIYNTRVTMGEKDSFTITKYRTGTEVALSGAIIGVFDAKGNEVLRQTTGENGTITVSGLRVGEYYYKEISAPTGYVLNSTEYHFTVENDGTVKSIGETNFVIYNNRVKAEHTVITKYVTDTKTPLLGAIIGLFDENGNEIERQTTNEKGQVDFTGLEPGTYKYKELIAPDGYILNETMYTFTIAEDGTVTFDSANGIIYNDKVTMKESFIITKKKTGTDTLVSGAIIGLFDENGNEIERQTTNEKGQVTFTGLEVGNYYYKEISAPAGYILNNTEYHFTVENDGTVTLAEGTTKVIYNDRVSKDHIIITKYVTGTTTQVSGAVIGLFDASGNKLAEQTTNEKGQVDFVELEPGTYKYKELTAPDGYVLNDTMYTFTIAEDGTVTFDSSNGIIYNSKVTMKDSLIIVKYRTNTKTPLPGAVIGVFDEKGKEIARQTTNENGTVTFTEIQVGNYYYKEISAPTGYVLNSTEYHFTVNNNGIATFAESATKVIYNNRLTVDHVIITKYEEGTKVAVAGAVIGLFDVDENEITRETTNEKGQVDFTTLEPGTYKYKELTAPDGYVLNDTMYTFTIAEDGTVTFDSSNGIIYNKKKEDKPDIPKVYGDVTLVKYEEGTTIRVEGAIIGIYDVNGNPIKNENGNVIQFITNEYGEAKFKIRPGTYQYKELKAPDGYILNETTYTFTVAEDGTVTFKENTNGIIYNKKKQEKPDVPEVYGNITIVKYEEGTKTGLKGAIIGIYDINKKEVKITTGENGTVSFKAKPGVYQYQELVAPDGYELNNTIYTFTVTKTGEVIFDNNTNGIIYDKKKEEKPVEPDNPDTPDIPDIPDKPDVPNKPEEPNKPVTPDTPKGNTIIPGQNTIIKEQPENMVNGRLPQTGETEGTIIVTLILAVFGIYFGIKIRNKQ